MSDQINELPQSGGAWVRGADGTLRRDDPGAFPAPDQKPGAKPTKKEA